MNLDLVLHGIESEDRRKGLLHPLGEVKRSEGRSSCTCNQIGGQTIIWAITESRAKGSCDLESVCTSTRACTSCGSCRPEGKAVSGVMTLDAGAVR